ncbi:nitroreductase family protein [Paenibacillus mendelii]|uniref:Putative NAD(P)H nitroreductase n=1 Tax=Paenibacillus mendelii TaxID=206163 RepID=A0ABV6JHY1_9BACL|nr:nitroreductase [Paenibacillus mendelii]MCQ6558394.1 nitroreductase [Paenibacillus mendelii]
MELFEAIATRRSVVRVKEDAVSREAIDQILEAGIWAPNHRLTEPWRFFVMSGEGRGKLGEAYYRIAMEGAADPGSPESIAAAEGAKKKALRAPVVIAVAVAPSDKKMVIEIEEYGAVFAAVQNMLLASHALGLGAIWRTGEPCYHPFMNEAFELRPQDRVLGLIYLGHPEGTSPAGRRESAASKTVWID